MPHHAQSNESDFHAVLLLVSDEKFGVSLCDITAGMNAVIGILQALLQRERTGRGSVVKVSLFDSAADLMAVPYLQGPQRRQRAEAGWPQTPEHRAVGVVHLRR